MNWLLRAQKMAMNPQQSVQRILSDFLQGGYPAAPDQIYGRLEGIRQRANIPDLCPFLTSFSGTAIQLGYGDVFNEILQRFGCSEMPENAPTGSEPTEYNEPGAMVMTPEQ